MAFDRHIFAAEVALGLVTSEQMPLRAQDAMLAGFDGPAVVRLAILENPSGWEVDQLLSRVFSELNVERPDEKTAALLLARARVDRIVALNEDPLPSLGYFHSLYLKSDYDTALLRLAYADEMVYPGTDDEVRAAMLEACAEFLDPELAARNQAQREELAREARRKALVEWPYRFNSPTGRKVYWRRLRDELKDRTAAWIFMVPALLLLWWATGSIRSVTIYLAVGLPLIVIVNAIRVQVSMRRECQAKRWRDRIDL